MRGNEKFRIGDKVRIINCSGIESYELNKIGTIVSINAHNSGGKYATIVVDMGRPRRPRCPTDDNETRWWLNASKIKLVNKPNTQLLFNFMKE